MTTHVGTSGFQYAEWKGVFYPEDLPAAKMLPYYAGHFSTTEINYTFHRIPSPKTIENWRKLTPEAFRFTLKAPQKVTHFARLRNCADTVDYFFEVASSLGDRLGPILFQLPPNLKKDAALLADFTNALPASMKATFEFRHASWFDDETYETLRRRNLALCLADTEDLKTPEIATADWGYLRLRREDYTDGDVLRWKEFIQARTPEWSETFVYFKHEERGMGPKLGQQLIALLAAGS
ncbi:MAG: DUF72 domain-containing protein [Verrucomicrobiota bacterium]|nr:DUF72 domain-containing protein [Verrucomicrobiota bacterium]